MRRLTGNMQNFPSQLTMQSCALCMYVRCGSSNQIKKIKKTIENYETFMQSWANLWWVVGGFTESHTFGKHIHVQYDFELNDLLLHCASAVGVNPTTNDPGA